MTKSSRRANLKHWFKTHSVALGVTTTLIVVLGGVLSLYLIDSRFSPSDFRNGGDGASIRLSISDHDNLSRFLPNNLTDPTTPNYTSDLRLLLPKEPDGDITSLFRAQGTLAYNSPNNTDKATITIELPPRLLLTPNQLKFGQGTYTFSYKPNGDPNTPSENGTGNEDLRIEKIQDVDQDLRGESYKITISNIDKKRFALNPFEHTQELYAQLNPLLEKAQAYSPPPAGNILIFRRPYQFRLTFRNLGTGGVGIPAANVDTAVAYLSERGEKDQLFFGNTNCGGSTSERGFLCLKTITKAFSATTQTPTILTLPIHQRIELSGVYLSGNIAALVEIQNLRLLPNAIAVGGKLTNVSGVTLTNYLQTNPTSVLKWSNTVDEQIDELYGRRNQGTIAQPLDTTAVWKLNSPTDDPDDSTAATTFSSPPEGKLWRTPSSLIFGGDVTFNGSGTIAVNGNLIFNGTVKCTGTKRLAFIVRGSITFNGLPNVDCGAFLALGNLSGSVPGSIFIKGEPPAGGATAKGIFVAKNDIQIPNAASSPQWIDYDADFAANPTVLFREFMSLILSASS